MNDNELFEVDLHYVIQEADLHAEKHLQYEVWRGQHGGELITARLYMYFSGTYQSGLIPATLRRTNFSNVINYRGFTYKGPQIYYIFDNYMFPLSEINKTQFPFIDADNRLTPFSRSIYRCSLRAIEELRDKKSMHHEFRERDVVIVLISGSFVQVKIIIQEYNSPLNVMDQIMRDFASVGVLHQFLSYGCDSAEKADLFARLYQIEDYKDSDTLLEAFGLDAMSVLKHPWFWVPSEAMYFLQKVGALLSDKLRTETRTTAVRWFIDSINALEVEDWNWKKHLIPKDDEDLKGKLATVHENDGVDFACGIRHLSCHYGENRISTQKYLEAHPWPFFKKIYDVKPSFTMHCFNVVEQYFAGDQGVNLDKYVPRGHFDDCLILPTLFRKSQITS